MPAGFTVDYAGQARQFVEEGSTLVIAFVLAPHVTRLPLWCTAFASVALVWRALLAWRQAPLPGRLLLTLLLQLLTVLTLL